MRETRKKLFSCLSVVIVILMALLMLDLPVWAADAYSLAEVSRHDTADDCWLVIDDQVYEVTDYLAKHEPMLDIRAWCGQDASQDYHDKAGQGEDHSSRADESLTQYLVGQLISEGSEEAVVIDTASKQTDDDQVKPSFAKKDYNIWLPIIITIVVYILSQKLLAKASHDFVWNSVQLLGLIPSFGFGLLMATGAAPGLREDHVEWSVVFGTACVLHFIYRFRVYRSQGKFSWKKLKKN